MTGVAPRPATFGFDVHCAEPLQFARLGGGVARLDVVTSQEPRSRPAHAPLGEWTLAGSNHEVAVSLYERPGGYEFWTSDVGGFRIDLEQGLIEMPVCDDVLLREQRLWSTPSVLTFVHRGDVPLHAAAVEVDGGAVLLAGPPKHGKTTLALAFHERGGRMLSEDLACCRLANGPQLLPGPALLRLRPDVYQGNAPPGTQLVRSRADRLFLALEPDRRGDGAPLPLRGIVFLRESPDPPRLERVAPAAALADLWALNFKLPTNQGRSASFRHLSGLAGGVSVWNLFRPLRLETLEPTVQLIRERLGQTAR